jgi:ATP-dependent dihydroxyacetone kinase
MTKLINRPESVVREMLEGQVMLTPGTALLPDETVVIRSDLDAGHEKVAVLSGGGSGHEPAHAGYVGAGMLTAAVAGDVFTSPSTDAVLAAIRRVAGPAGALLIVKNYTGDRLNFGLAAEIARSEGIPVEVVIVADDVALRDTVAAERRRGIAGTILVHKIAGAAAEAGRPLADVAALARRTAQAVGSMGIALGSCTLPAVGRPGFTLGESEIEVGLGIHGEQGVRRTAMVSANELSELVLETIIDDLGLTAGTPVALLVNGLGATPPMELAIIARAALKGLRDRGLVVQRAWGGTLLSALDMPGFSLSLLPLDDELFELLDAPTAAPSWPGHGLVNAVPEETPRPGERRNDDRDSGLAAEPDASGALVRRAALAAADAMSAAEPRLTELDSLAGDGDLGQSMQRGAEAVRALPIGRFATASSGLSAIADALRRAIGGSSGPFYATALMRASRQIGPRAEVSPESWVEAFDAAVGAISELGGAKVGDRTMVDALRPAADAFRVAIATGKRLSEAWADAVLAAEQGVEATRSMQPRAGRASYLGERAVGVSDAGAAAVVEWMKAI